MSSLDQLKELGDSGTMTSSSVKKWIFSPADAKAIIVKKASGARSVREQKAILPITQRNTNVGILGIDKLNAFERKNFTLSSRFNLEPPDWSRRIQHVLTERHNTVTEGQAVLQVLLGPTNPSIGDFEKLSLKSDPRKEDDHHIISILME